MSRQLPSTERSRFFARGPGTLGSRPLPRCGAALDERSPEAQTQASARSTSSTRVAFMRIAPAFVALAGALLSSTLHAQTPAPAPAGATGLCKDGTYSTNATKSGACSGHKGVKSWFASTAAAAPAAAPMTTAAPPAVTPTSKPALSAAAPVAAAPIQRPARPPRITAPTTAPSPATPTPAPATTSPAPGGGIGQVWVNASSKAYHCPGSRWYGKTKHGSYMTEAAAKAAGNHPDHGNACAA